MNAACENEMKENAYLQHYYNMLCSWTGANSIEQKPSFGYISIIVISQIVVVPIFIDIKITIIVTSVIIIMIRLTLTITVLIACVYNAITTA